MLKARAMTLSLIGALAAIAALAFLARSDVDGPISSDSMQQVWAARVDRLVKEPPGWTLPKGHETRAVAFSPDETRLALTVTHNEFISPGNVIFNTHLFVLDVSAPETNVRQFDLTGTCGVDLTWNESGDTMLVCGTLLRLADGASCAVNPAPSSSPNPARYNSVNQAFWLDSTHVVRSTGEILDLACRPAGTWQLEPAWRIGAVAPSRGWLVLRHVEGFRPGATPEPRSLGPLAVNRCEYMVLETASHRALNGTPIRGAPCGEAVTLVAGADALCFPDDTAIATRKLHCWEVSGGREIFLSEQARDYVINQSATSSARVVADKWEYARFAFEKPPLPRRRAILDLRSGTWISSWKPRIQDSTSPDVKDWPYHCALSAHGELFAESGDGSLELYRITP
jgi:hypothetical protein